jgi:hypothetical protein
MLILSLLGVAMVAATVLMHAVGTTQWVRHLARRHLDENGEWRPRSVLRVLIATAVVLLILHMLQVTLWAAVYRWVLPAGGLETFEQALYFSLVTFTTLGYGDITLGPEWRLLSGIEALNGILLVGWTTALLFAVVQRTWRAMSVNQAGSQ